MAYKQQVFISHSDGGWEVKTVVLADLVSCENPLPKGRIFLVTSHGGRTKKALASLFFFFFNKFIYLFILAVLGLHFCARAFSSCGKRGSPFIAVRGPRTIAASFVAEHRLQTRRLSSCGSRAQLLPGMWDLPKPRLEPVSPALAGRFSTTAPPGKPTSLFYKGINLIPKGSTLMT